MKKAAKKVTKKEAASPKGKAAAGKGIVPVIEFKPANETGVSDQKLYWLYVKGRKTKQLFSSGGNEYYEYGHTNLKGFEELKDVNCLEFPDQFILDLEVKSKLIVGEIGGLRFGRKDNTLFLKTNIHVENDELLTMNLNPIKLLAFCFEKFPKKSVTSLFSFTEIDFSKGKESDISVHFDFEMVALSTLGNRVEALTDYINSLMYDAAAEMMAELTPAKKKK